MCDENVVHEERDCAFRGKQSPRSPRIKPLSNSYLTEQMKSSVIAILKPPGQETSATLPSKMMKIQGESRFFFSKSLVLWRERSSNNTGYIEVGYRVCIARRPRKYYT